MKKDYMTEAERWASEPLTSRLRRCAEMLYEYGCLTCYQAWTARQKVDAKYGDEKPPVGPPAKAEEGQGG